MNENVKALRPLPKTGSYIDTKEFWDGAKRGKLMLQFCTEAKRFQHFPRPVSLFTGRKTVEWREASGYGTVYSWTVTRSPWPGHEQRVPYICAYVELDEGVRFLCNLVDCDENEVEIGMPVEVRWDRLTEEIAFPDFAPRRR
ncbi:OB-fold domain-containing protein [Bradyrhizobium sp. Arg237L]|uniref:Zn-ribbon domain-containing OB-fold protein n=1 Tax=Bradyrhizobium sp. Arg237L TaxID=3003352 RepID=UPI00249EEF15|nr:OB-fold domain-containing protein [Bradyrhizobium sp. Arg237L]MDI4231752.1 OB-fold domain-containing protein [Bradyrhizobium sp. Arg237L]